MPHLLIAKNSGEIKSAKYCVEIDLDVGNYETARFILDNIIHLRNEYFQPALSEGPGKTIVDFHLFTVLSNNNCSMCMHRRGNYFLCFKNHAL